MILQVECGFDIFTLFIHERNSVSPLDEWIVEDQLNMMVEQTEMAYRVRFECPGKCGLDRWQLWVDDQPVFTSRPYTRKDVTQALKEFPGLMVMCHTLNGMTLKCVDGENFDIEDQHEAI